MNVRWDAVVDRNAVSVGSAPQPATAIARGRSQADIHANVQLFGALASFSPDRFFKLELPADATIADVINSLGERLGEPFLTQVIDDAGRKRRSCRLFISGEPTESLQAPLGTTPDPVQIEIILLVSPEGG